MRFLIRLRFRGRQFSRGRGVGQAHDFFCCKAIADMIDYMCRLLFFRKTGDGPGGCSGIPAGGFLRKVVFFYTKKEKEGKMTR